MKKRPGRQCRARPEGRFAGNGGEERVEPFGGGAIETVCTPRDAAAKGVAQSFELGAIGSAGERCDDLPLVVRAGEDLVGASAGAKEAGGRRVVLARPALGEDIPDERPRPGRSGRRPP